MITFEEAWAEYGPVIAGIANEYGRKAHDWGAEADDFSQEFAAWMLDNEHKLSDKHDEIADDEEFGRYLARCLRGQASDYSLDIRAQAGGQDRATAYWYTKAEVEYLLDCVFDEDKWQEAPIVEGAPSRQSNPAQGGNWVATLADVSQALAKLAVEDQWMLRKFHDPDIKESNKAMASWFDITEAAMSSRHTRAVNRLLKQLGGRKPTGMRPNDRDDPWRGRHSIPTSRARATTDAGW